MINFTVGPVMSSAAVCAQGAKQVPYFRTPEFSAIMYENENLIKNFMYAEDEARVVFLTGSGTASMEAVVMNIFTPEDKLLVVNGGSFGRRFVQLCEIFEIPYDEVVPEYGYGITADQLNVYDGKNYTGFLVNIDETSIGVLYDIDLISDFCSRNNIFLVVDSISSFLCDPLNMQEKNVQVLITGSQKALACPPGVSIVALSKKAIDRVNSHKVKSMYLDLKSALLNGERGQTPFTPAVGILLQINTRLKEIQAAGGVEAEIKRTAMLANDFRNKISNMPFEIASHSMTNAVTPLHPLNASAYDIFTTLKNEYGIWVCPNSGEMAEKIFRVGHLGALTLDDNLILINSLKDMMQRGLL